MVCLWFFTGETPSPLFFSWFRSFWTHTMDRIAAGFLMEYGQNCCRFSMTRVSGLRQCNEQWFHGDFGFFLIFWFGHSERLDLTWVISFLFWFCDGLADSAARDSGRWADVTRSVGCMPRRCGYFGQCCLGDFEIFFAIFWLGEIRTYMGNFFSLMVG